MPSQMWISGKILQPRATAVDWNDSPSHTNKALLITYDILYFVGPVLLLAVIITAWLCEEIRQRRLPTWFMAVGSWVFLSASNIMLIGRQSGPAPPDAVCLAQAMLIYAAPVLVAFSAVSFLLQTYLKISCSRLRKYGHFSMEVFTFYVIPCAISIFLILGIFIAEAVNPNSAHRDQSGLYCNFKSWRPRQITGAFIMFALLLVLVLEGLIFITYRRRTRDVKEIYKSELIENPRDSVPVEDVIRVGAFTVCAIISFSVSFLQYVSVNNGVISVIQATLPCCAGLIYGTQKDIVKVWVPRKKKGEAPFVSMP